MSRLVSRNKSISYIIIVVAVLVFLAIWPTQLIRYGVTAKSDEIIAKESDPISVEYNLTQMFDGIGGILQSVDLYVCNDMSGQIVTFRLYDKEHQQIYEQFYNVDIDFVAPGFINIPIRYELVDGEEYSFIVEGLTQELYLAYEDRATTTSPVNYFMAYGGAIVPEYDVIVRYNVDRPFSTLYVVLSAIALALIATCAFMILKRVSDKEVEQKKVLQVTINPVLAFLAILTIYITMIRRLFGPNTKNNAFVALGFLMFLALGAYVVNFVDVDFDIKKLKKIDIKKILQSISIATMLWYCYEYMNGLYDIFHYYSLCKMLIAFAALLICTFSNKDIFNVPNAVWLVLGPIVGYLYAKPHLLEENTGELYRLYGWLIAAYGFVVINIVITIIKVVRKKQISGKINMWFLVPFAIWGISISILANTRWWIWILVGMCVLLMYRLMFWEKRQQFLCNICSGIVINFYMMVWFSLNHRPYYYYQFYRYNMGYHTVTVTAYYLTLIICAAIVRIYVKSKECKDIKEMIPRFFTFGMSVSFLLFTMSRTGFLSTAAVIITFMIATAIKDKETSLKRTVKYFVVMIVALLYMFPITYAFVDICPRVANDPITFEYEYREFTFEKGMPYSDINYMTIDQFVREFGKKVFKIEPSDYCEEISLIKSSIDKINPFVMKTYAMDEGILISSETDEDVTDMSNGRFDIFRSYIGVWNAWGHDEMGTELPDGEIAIHAHNSFLQVIHDHGLVFGIYFILYMLYIFVLSVKRAFENKDGYETILPVLMLGFCVASLVEWIFHVCNPFGLALFISIMSLSVKPSEKKVIE